MPARSTIAAMRFGYGFRPGEAPPRDVDDLLGQLTQGPGETRFAQGALADRMAQLRRMREARKAARGSDKPPEEVKRMRRQMRRALILDGHRRIEQAALSPAGFRERLAWFWTDHFTVSARNRAAAPGAPFFERDAIRPHVSGDFASMLRATATHPAMLVYLDQHISIGPNSRAGRRREKGLNENYARELLELHTVGVDGGYDQKDVTQLAKLLTGLGFDRKTGGFVFRPRIAEPGPKAVLGRVYGDRSGHDLRDIERVLADLAAHPATARHLARKLAAHFVADDPGERLIGRLEQAYARSGGQLGPMYRALLEDDESWARFGEKAKQPFGFLVSGLRALGAPAPLMAPNDKGRANPLSVGALVQMGQPLWSPQGPDGWSEAASDWITPQGLAARLEWCAAVARRFEDRLDPRTLLETALGDAARSQTRFLVEGAPQRQTGIAVVLASPEFNRC